MFSRCCSAVHRIVFLAAVLASFNCYRVGSAGHSCPPLEFGAAGDGVTPDTEAVQAAVDACSQGGVVPFEAGRTYLLGRVEARGSVHLVLPPGAVLLASAQRQHYGRGGQHTWYALDFHRCKNCSLTGGGTVQGPAAAFQDKRGAVSNWADPSCRTAQQCRPRLVGVRDSEHVSIAGVTLRDAAFWTLHVLCSRHVALRGLIIRGSMDYPNNDGIDVDSSSHVTITDCDIATADDALCIKTTSSSSSSSRVLQRARGGRSADAVGKESSTGISGEGSRGGSGGNDGAGCGVTSHVSATNCTLRSKSAAIKLGSESRADMRHLLFSDIRVIDAHRGLAIQLRDWGHVSNVTFANVTVSTRRYGGRWWGAGEPIYVTAVPRWPNRPVGRVTNVSFVNVTAVTAGGAVLLSGSPESELRDLRFVNVSVRFAPSPADLSWKKQAHGVALPRVHDAARGGGSEPLAAAGGADAAAGKAAGAERGAASNWWKGVRTWFRGSTGDLPPTVVKLDRRPGPYGVAPLRNARPAPVLAQFVEGLQLQGVELVVEQGSPVDPCAWLSRQRAWGLGWLWGWGGVRWPWMSDLVGHTVIGVSAVGVCFKLVEQEAGVGVEAVLGQDLELLCTESMKGGGGGKSALLGSSSRRLFWLTIVAVLTPIVLWAVHCRWIRTIRLRRASSGAGVEVGVKQS